MLCVETPVFIPFTKESTLKKWLQVVDKFIGEAMSYQSHCNIVAVTVLQWEIWVIKLTGLPGKLLSYLGNYELSQYAIVFRSWGLSLYLVSWEDISFYCNYMAMEAETY